MKDLRSSGSPARRAGLRHLALQTSRARKIPMCICGCMAVTTKMPSLLQRHLDMMAGGGVGLKKTECRVMDMTRPACEDESGWGEQRREGGKENTPASLVDASVVSLRALSPSSSAVLAEAANSYTVAGLSPTMTATNTSGGPSYPIVKLRPVPSPARR